MFFFSKNHALKFKYQPGQIKVRMKMIVGKMVELCCMEKDEVLGEKPL
jgi:hypothetical protein